MFPLHLVGNDKILHSIIPYETLAVAFLPPLTLTSLGRLPSVSRYQPPCTPHSPGQLRRNTCLLTSCVILHLQLKIKITHRIKHGIPADVNSLRLTACCPWLFAWTEKAGSLWETALLCLWTPNMPFAKIAEPGTMSRKDWWVHLL